MTPTPRAEPVWRVGESVPWSVAWTGEQAFRVQPSKDFPGLLELDQRQDPGSGEPIFAAVHVTRIERSAEEGTPLVRAARDALDARVDTLRDFDRHSERL